MCVCIYNMYMYSFSPTCQLMHDTFLNFLKVNLTSAKHISSAKESTITSLPFKMILLLLLLFVEKVIYLLTFFGIYYVPDTVLAAMETEINQKYSCFQLSNSLPKYMEEAPHCSQRNNYRVSAAGGTVAVPILRQN